MSGALALHNGALGDLIVSLPALRALRRACGPPLVVIGAEPRLELALRPRGPIDRIATLSLEEQLALYQGGGGLPSSLAGFEAAVSFGEAPAALRSAYGDRLHEMPSFRRLSGAPADRALLAALPPRVAARAPARPRLALPRRAEPRGFLIQPGAGSAAKRWPASRWASLAEELIKAGLGPGALVLGPAELEPGRPCADAIAEAFADSALPRRRPERPRALAELLARCRLFVGHDSGPSHLAAALGCPCLALFGPASDARVWRPRGPRVRVLTTRGNDWRVLSVEDVARAAVATTQGAN